jgi:hypothetical protein
MIDRLAGFERHPLTALTAQCRGRQNVRDRFGSEAVVQTHSGPMTALGWNADARPGQMSALTNTGQSEPLDSPYLNGC